MTRPPLLQRVSVTTRDCSHAAHLGAKFDTVAGQETSRRRRSQPDQSMCSRAVRTRAKRSAWLPTCSGCWRGAVRGASDSPAR
jgi:hypothetical protein